MLFRSYKNRDPIYFIINHKIEDNLDIGQFDKNDILYNPIHINDFLNQFYNVEQYVKVESVYLNKLEKLLKSIDKRRKDGYEGPAGKFRTIKRTENNPESSRSIFMMEIKIQMNGKFIPFVILDMPGREELLITYKDEKMLKMENYPIVNPDTSSQDYFVLNSPYKIGRAHV